MSLCIPKAVILTLCFISNINAQLQLKAGSTPSTQYYKNSSLPGQTALNVEATTISGVLYVPTTGNAADLATIYEVVEQSFTEAAAAPGISPTGTTSSTTFTLTLVTPPGLTPSYFQVSPFVFSSITNVSPSGPSTTGINTNVSTSSQTTSTTGSSPNKTPTIPGEGSKYTTTSPSTDFTSPLTSSATTTSNSSAATTSPATIKKHDRGLIAGIAVLAVVLAFALGLLAFMTLLRLRSKKNKQQRQIQGDQGTITYHDKGQEEDHAATERSLRNQLSELQGALLATNSKVATKDDKSLSHEWVQINNEIKQWAIDYFHDLDQSTILPINLQQVLQQIAPNYQFLLSKNKTKILLVRALVNHVVQSNYQDNGFFGKSSVAAVINASKANSMLCKFLEIGSLTDIQIELGSRNTTNYNLWRSDTYHLLENSQETQIALETASKSIADTIETLAFPLASGAQFFGGDRARYEFLLHRIVERASKFAFDLQKQRAEFHIISYAPGTLFSPNDMEDFLQTSSVAPQNTQIQATVMSSIRKKGNEDGQGYDRQTVVCKADVLL